MKRACKDCAYWVKDRRAMRGDGYCHFEVTVVRKKEDDFCSRFEPSESEEWKSVKAVS